MEKQTFSLANQITMVANNITFMTSVLEVNRISIDIANAYNKGKVEFQSQVPQHIEELFKDALAKLNEASEMMEDYLAPIDDGSVLDIVDLVNESRDLTFELPNKGELEN